MQKAPLKMVSNTYGDNTTVWTGNTTAVDEYPYSNQEMDRLMRVAERRVKVDNLPRTRIEEIAKEVTKPMSERRLVRVIIADPDTNVPVEDALIHDSKEIFTDKTDDELYFDIPVAELLKTHNEKRVKIRNKDVKEREEMLEPTRIRDITMVVLTLAEL